jgi:hypothetical protein
MGLADALEAAKQRARIERWDRGEATVASQLKLDVPAVELSPAIHEHFAVFTRWCEVRACRKCPSKPATIAAFVLEQKELGVPSQTIIERLEAIDAQHQHFGLPSSVHTRIVDAALERVLDIKPPRWNHSSRTEWAKLPPLVRAAITKREDQRDLALRHSQSKIARELELRQNMNDAAKIVHTETEKDQPNEVQR